MIKSIQFRLANKLRNWWNLLGYYYKKDVCNEIFFSEVDPAFFDTILPCSAKSMAAGSHKAGIPSDIGDDELVIVDLGEGKKLVGVKTYKHAKRGTHQIMGRLDKLLIDIHDTGAEDCIYPTCSNE